MWESLILKIAMGTMEMEMGIKGYIVNKSFKGVIIIV